MRTKPSNTTGSFNIAKISTGQSSLGLVSNFLTFRALTPYYYLLTLFIIRHNAPNRSLEDSSYHLSELHQSGGQILRHFAMQHCNIYLKLETAIPTVYYVPATNLLRFYSVTGTHASLKFYFVLSSEGKFSCPI